MKSLKTSKLLHASLSKWKVDDDSEDEDDTIIEDIVEDMDNHKNLISALKIDFELKIPHYNGVIYADKLENLIDEL